MRIQYTLLIGLILLAFMMLGALLSAYMFKQSDFDRKYLLRPINVKHLTMCV